MKIIQVRLNDEIYDWIKKMADIEGVPISTMIRIFLNREKYRENIEKQFDKKKRGNK